MKTYWKNSDEAIYHVSDDPTLTTISHHSWSWYKEYKIFDSIEEMKEWVVAQPLSDGTTGRQWFSYEDHVINREAYKVRRKINQEAFAARVFESIANRSEKKV